jgi:hypothetical protein
MIYKTLHRKLNIEHRELGLTHVHLSRYVVF